MSSYLDVVEMFAEKIIKQFFIISSQTETTKEFQDYSEKIIENLKEIINELNGEKDENNNLEDKMRDLNSELFKLKIESEEAKKKIESLKFQIEESNFNKEKKYEDYIVLNDVLNTLEMEIKELTQKSRSIYSNISNKESEIMTLLKKKQNNEKKNKELTEENSKKLQEFNSKHSHEFEKLRLNHSQELEELKTIYSKKIEDIKKEKNDKLEIFKGDYEKDFYEFIEEWPKIIEELKDNARNFEKNNFFLLFLIDNSKGKIPEFEILEKVVEKEKYLLEDLKKNIDIPPILTVRIIKQLAAKNIIEFNEKTNEISFPVNFQEI